MKNKEKEDARQLREEGCSIKEISRKVGVSKSSVSIWTRNIVLSEEQQRGLSERGRSKKSIEKRRMSRLKNEADKRQKIIDKAKKRIEKISKHELLLIGSALYWAEGGKTQRGIVRFSNGDPRMIRLMMNFFEKIWQVPIEKMRGYIHIHPHLDEKRAERYWAKVSGIPLSRFYKTYKKQNKASKGLRDSLPFGTFDIYIFDTKLFLSIQGWMEKIFKITGASDIPDAISKE
jgi:transcriptional regulator with XRE-family HTH domain